MTTTDRAPPVTLPIALEGKIEDIADTVPGTWCRQSLVSRLEHVSDQNGLVDGRIV